MLTGLAVFPSLASAATSHPDFAAQATSAGLTSAQAQSLQARVNNYLAETGGTQVAINEISLSGANIFLTLPGQTQSRDLTTGAVSPQSVAASCNYGHMCAYANQNFSGDTIDMYTCGNYSIPWVGTGSWINNQTTGTRAQFKSSDGVTRWTSAGAYTNDPSADWSWVWHVQNC